ncbi:MAG: thiamine diphosphokinase [Clostridia bacterium]|nr:thiamine diphosphokinase [Clostridia bacterium]
MTIKDSWPPYQDEPVCVVLGAMPITQREAEEIRSLQDRFLICADAGLLNAQKYGFKPDLTMGDFDSLEGGEASVVGEKLNFLVEKDDTDTMLGIKEGISRGYRRFLLYGSLGGRLDHSLANIMSLRYLLDEGARGWIMSEENCVTLLQNGSMTFERDERYPHFSVFSYEKEARGVRETGFKYVASGVAGAGKTGSLSHTMTNVFPLGVSNSIVEERATLSVEDGILLIVRAK